MSLFPQLLIINRQQNTQQNKQHLETTAAASLSSVHFQGFNSDILNAMLYKQKRALSSQDYTQEERILWLVKPTWAHQGSVSICVWSCSQLSQHRTIFQVSISHKEFTFGQAIIHRVSTSVVVQPWKFALCFWASFFILWFKLFFRLHSIIGYYKMLNIISCALQ